MGEKWKQGQILFWGPYLPKSTKITVDSDHCHEIKRCLLLGSKALTNLDSILKNREITLWPKVYIVKHSHPYIITGKIIALTRQTFVGKVMPLLLNILSRLVITFLPRSKSLSISCLQSLSAVILEPTKIKSDTVSTVSPSICHEVIGPDAMILIF